jgi:hypothetical protein
VAGILQLLLEYQLDVVELILEGLGDEPGIQLKERAPVAASGDDQGPVAIKVKARVSLVDVDAGLGRDGQPCGVVTEDPANHSLRIGPFVVGVALPQITEVYEPVVLAEITGRDDIVLAHPSGAGEIGVFELPDFAGGAWALLDVADAGQAGGIHHECCEEARTTAGVYWLDVPGGGIAAGVVQLAIATLADARQV